MRIAVLTSEFPSVSETFVLNHVADLVARGHEVDVYPERSPESAVAHPDIARYALLDRRHLPPPMPTRRLARILRAARLAVEHRAGENGSLIRSLNPVSYGRQGASLALLYRQLPFLRQRPYDVIHCHHGPVGLVAAQLRRLGVLSGRLATSFHGHDVNVAPRHRGPNLYAPLFREANLLLANSDFTRERLLALGAPSQRLLVQPMGVDLDLFRPGERTESGQLQIVSVGRLAEEKGFEIALRAVARLALRHERLHYRIVGDGPRRAQLERLASDLGIGQRVEFVGALPHDAIRAHLVRGDVFCLPSLTGHDGAQESQGLALVEAQACGLPVVASAIGGIPESLRDGVTGYLVPERNPVALADRLEPLLACPERRRSMGAAARAFVARHFDRRILADRLIERYERLQHAPHPSGRKLPGRALMGRTASR